jgi:hypothetical protein
MTPSESFDSRYVEARRVLLDALFALSPHNEAIIVVGAQAVYLRTGESDIAVAPFTTDGDLALDPSHLGEDPKLETALRGANFHLLEDRAGHVQPGSWITGVKIDGQDHIIPLDLLVPEAAAPAPGKRGARLGSHGNQAARKVRGIEATLVEHDTMRIESLDPADDRSIDAEVAGSAALLIAKAHKIGERIASGNVNRYDDKDAADVLRIMQTTNPSAIAETMAMLREHPMAGEATRAGLDYLQQLFGRRGGGGIAMAARSLREAVPEDRIAVICTAYIGALFDAPDTT